MLKFVVVSLLLAIISFSSVASPIIYEPGVKVKKSELPLGVR